MIDLFERLWSVGTRLRHYSSSASSASGTKKNVAVPPFSTVHGGQYDTKYVRFEQLFHAAFVANTFWGDNLEPARKVLFLSEV